MNSRTSNRRWLWTLIDEILNSVLFLLIGLEVLVIGFGEVSLKLALLAIPIVLLARLVAVAVPMPLAAWRWSTSARNIPFLT